MSLSKFIVRRNTRLSFVQLVTERNFRGQFNLQDFLEDSSPWVWGEFDQEMLTKLVDATEEKWDDFLCIAKSSISDRWSWERMDPVLQAIILCAVTEIYSTDLDIRILIAEYKTVAEGFYDHNSKEIGFVKTVINKIATNRRAPENQTSDAEKIS